MALAICQTRIDETGRELIEHGTAAFPVACYHDDLQLTPVPWHWHQELELAVITAGSCTVSIGQQKRVLSAGEGFFANTSALHGVWADREQACRCHSLVFHPRLVGGSLDSVFYGYYLQPILQRQDLEGLFFTQAEDRAILQSLESAWQACAQEPPGYEFTVRQELSRIIYTIYSRLRPQVQALPEKNLRQAERVKQMLSYIHANYAADLSAADIAASALISPSECLRCFRVTIGTSPMQYVKQYRLQQAALQLKNSSRKVADIAALCGFQDISYFNRTFRARMGCTPGQYRKKEDRTDCPGF